MSGRSAVSYRESTKIDAESQVSRLAGVFCGCLCNYICENWTRHRLGAGRGNEGDGTELKKEEEEEEEEKDEKEDEEEGRRRKTKEKEEKEEKEDEGEGREGREGREERP